ncbi:hypothetical protein [Streptomyces sp. NPDC005955]|uniref:hypothetical protein n=1 Tax=Streptomyces sp. NPDC005955 TaxID=3364738 RepID=UPI0036CC3BD8
MSKGIWPDEIIPGGVAAKSPFALDVLRLFGLDGAWGEEVLALCDLYPDVDGGVLAFAVADRWPDGAGKRWQLADQGVPFIRRKGPVPERLASALVVDEWSPGCSEFGTELAEDSFELGWTASCALPAFEVGVGSEPHQAWGDAEVGRGLVERSAYGPLDEPDCSGSA